MICAAALSMTAVALILAPAQPATANPPGCAGTRLVDGRGDGRPSGLPNNTALDIVAAHLVYEEEQLFAVVQVDDMALPSENTTYAYDYVFTGPNGTWYASAYVSSNETTFINLPTESGQEFVTTSGAVTGGPGGGVRIRIDERASGGRGSHLRQFSASTTQVFGSSVSGPTTASTTATANPADSTAPSNGTYTVGPCSGSAGPPPATAPSTPPSPSQPPSGEPQPSGSGGESRPRPAPVLPLAIARIQAGAGRRTLRVRVTTPAGRPVRHVAAVLLRRLTPAARTPRPILVRGTRTLVLRAAQRLGRGAYLLVVTGRLPDGRTATRVRQIRLG
jgi:hypothetical protein